MYLSGILPVLFAAILLIGADDPKPDAKKDAKQPPPKLTLGKDTTYVTGPLDKDGYIDYEAALNAELGRGVTRDTNANVLLIQAFGPAPEGGRGLPLAYFKWLDIQPPPQGGDYFLDIGKYARDRLSLNDNQLNGIYTLMSRASQRPWSAKDNPVLAEWLKFNDKQLALAVEATKRPDYFNPLCSRFDEDKPGSLIGALLPSVQKCRELVNALTCRAMLRIEEKKYDDAWQDLLAAHRLGRLIGRGGTLIESLVGIAISAIASNSTLTYLERVPLTSKEVMGRLKDLQGLPPFSPAARSIDSVERFMGLETMQMMRRQGGSTKYLEGLLESEIVNASPEELKALGMLDWDAAMRNMNKWYDKLAAGMRIEDRVKRERALDQLDKELLDRKQAIANPEKLGELVRKAKKPSKELATEVAVGVSDVLIGLLTPAIRKVLYAHDRAEQIDRNLQVAFAMAAFKIDNGKYPAKLDDLAPKYLAKVPGDVFSGKPLIYKPSEKGYLFYSVGQNGKDDGGRWYDDKPPGDDPRVKMPLPELKKEE